MVRGLKPHSNSKHPLAVAAALGAVALITGLAYLAGGTNCAAVAFTVVGIGLWLWSARRSYRTQGSERESRLVVDRVGALADEEQPRTSHRRIRVANVGGRSLHYVEVKLIGCSPTPLWFQPVRLQRTHGGPHPFDLAPQSEVYIDLIALPHGHPDFILVQDSATHGGLPNSLPIQALDLTVQVTAEALPTASFRFRASRSSTGKLELVAAALLESDRPDRFQGAP